MLAGAFAEAGSSSTEELHPRCPEYAPLRDHRQGDSFCPGGERRRRKGLLLGHLCNVLVAQGYPQVVVLVQKHFLHPCLSDATRLIPRERMSPQNSSSPLWFIIDKSSQSQMTNAHMNDFTSPMTTRCVTVCIRSMVWALTQLIPWAGRDPKL